MDAESEHHIRPELEPERWVDAYADSLYRYALLRVGDADAAEDLVQETFLAALSARERFEGKASERTWLIAILRYKISEYWRKHKRVVTAANPEAAEDVSDFFDAAGHWKPAPKDWKGDPQEQLNNEEFWQTFQKCVSQMGEGLSDAFFMRELEDISTPQICEQLKISPEGLWSRLHRARLHLRHCLEKNWFIEKIRGLTS